MKYCKKCGVLYSTDVCPKCGIIYPPKTDETAPTEKKSVRRQWLALIIGIPAMIALIYVVLRLIYT